MRSFPGKFFQLSQYQLIVMVFGMMGFVSSCVTLDKTTYLQERETSEYSGPTYTPDEYKIQPFDNLFVRVVTPDPRWAEMFNTISVTGGVGFSDQSVDIVSYTVRQDSAVDIPFLGFVHVAGKTIAEAKVLLDSALADYISDAAITVKLVNSYVSILGEVENPGQYPIYKEQMNIFQVMAMAGDMGDYSNRYEVSIIRKTAEGSIVREFDLTDREILDSEFYYVMPNDVIYAKPMKGKFFAMNQFPFALILSTITTFVLVMNYIQ